MATTSLWAIYQRLDKVIDYTTNIEKIKNKDYGMDLYKSLHDTVEYIKADFKTEKQYYVTGINCVIQNAMEEMVLTKKRFGKTNRILAYHGYQSFAKGEVTASQAHEIGVKLAEELWGDKYEVLVSTHLNTEHFHNHFLINSVSFLDGEKYSNNRRTYALMRKTSDELCKEYGLSVIEEKPCGNLKIDYTKYYNSYVQKNDYCTSTKDDVDFAIKQAYSYKNFEDILQKMGYTITIRANKISLCRPPYKRNIRIERSFGEEYSIYNIKERIMNTEMERRAIFEKYKQPKKYTGRIKNQIKVDRGSLYRLYLHYCYLLKVFPKYHRYKITPKMREDIKKMNEISNKIRFLCRNKIKTTKELFLYKKLVTDELKNQMKVRNVLRRKRQKETNSEKKQKLCDEILDLSNKIKFLKKEVGYCQKVEEQSQKIKDNIKELQLKEMEEKNRKKGELEK